MPRRKSVRLSRVFTLALWTWEPRSPLPKLQFPMIALIPKVRFQDFFPKLQFQDRFPTVQFQDLFPRLQFPLQAPISMLQILSLAPKVYSQRGSATMVVSDAESEYKFLDRRQDC